MQVSKVLVVDGDRAARDALIICLKFVGMEAHGAENAAAAQSWLTTGVADVLILSDEIADCVSADSSASVLVLTREASAFTGPPHLRADATLRRPIALSCVVERVESLIEARKGQKDGILNFAVLSLDVASGCASSGNTHVALPHIEARLLAFFIGFPDRVFSRTQLMQRLWPANVRIAERTVDVHIGRLRQALAQLDCACYLQTVRCAGYRFSAF